MGVNELTGAANDPEDFGIELMGATWRLESTETLTVAYTSLPLAKIEPAVSPRGRGTPMNSLEIARTSYTLLPSLRFFVKKSHTSRTRSPTLLLRCPSFDSSTDSSFALLLRVILIVSHINSG